MADLEERIAELEKENEEYSNRVVELEDKLKEFENAANEAYKELSSALGYIESAKFAIADITAQPPI